MHGNKNEKRRFKKLIKKLCNAKMRKDRAVLKQKVQN